MPERRAGIWRREVDEQRDFCFSPLTILLSRFTMNSISFFTADAAAARRRRRRIVRMVTSFHWLHTKNLRLPTAYNFRVLIRMLRRRLRFVLDDIRDSDTTRAEYSICKRFSDITRDWHFLA